MNGSIFQDEWMEEMEHDEPVRSQSDEELKDTLPFLSGYIAP